jgi:protein STE50
LTIFHSGDAFVILSRARGWWVVQRDDAGTGHVDTDTTKQGWVPAGCLLETKVPVASAIAEANARIHSGEPSSPSLANEEQKKRPILPLSIVSTSFPGVALMDYPGKGDEELDLVKDESLRVFKRYNHWSYAVKEESGDRGWVPVGLLHKFSSPSSDLARSHGTSARSRKPRPLNRPRRQVPTPSIALWSRTTCLLSHHQ